MRNPSPKPRGKRSERDTKPKREEQSGIAIVTVLSVLLLMSVLMLALFSGAKSELESSRYYADSLRTRQLTDIVTSVVIAQIREATGTGRSRGRLTWASQPGLITKYTDANSMSYQQSVASKHKLYSSARMFAGPSDNLAGDVETDWNDHPHRWVDLNEPVYSALDTKTYFPIADPRAFDRNNGVEGFDYSDKTSTGVSIEGVVKPGSSEEKARIPMPVQWLYILDDGTLGHLDDANRFVPSGSGGDAPSRLNPISARIAFWTDDESSKINVNTAAEGIPWDTPHYESSGQRNYSRYPPAKNEFYRYAGHPAMVSLSSVLYPGQDISNDTAKLQHILDISPRNAWEGSSKAGTSRGTGVELDSDRLYATVDELIYEVGKSPRSENKIFGGSGNNGPRRMLERGRFFLTANSVAPETTLWGTPKMSLWPIPNGTKSTFDRLLAFCNELPGTRGETQKFYWQRNNPTSRHNEVYGLNGGQNIELLWDYVAPHSYSKVPGYGRTLLEKYGGSTGQETDNFQILAQIWDGVRTTNLDDPAGGSKYQRNSGSASTGQVASCCLCGGAPTGGNHASRQHMSRWSLNSNKGKGFGRLFMASEVTMVFINGGALSGSVKQMEVGIVIETFCPSHGFSKIWPQSSCIIVTPSTKATGSEITFANEASPKMRVAVQSDSGGQINDEHDMDGNNFTRSSVVGTSGSSSTNDEQRWWGAHGGPELYLQAPLQFKNSEGDSVKIPYTLDENDLITVSMEDTWRIIFFDASNARVGDLIQFADIDWPGSFKIPPPLSVEGSAAQTWAGRVRTGDAKKLIFENDVTRSMVVRHGDFRLSSAKRFTESSVFAPHHNFAKTGQATTRHAHSLTAMNGDKLVGYSIERGYIGGITYPEQLLPDFANAPGGAGDYYGPSSYTEQGVTFSNDPMITGDFDSGIGFHMDGPYVNRADDGSGGDNPYFDKENISTPKHTSDRNLFAPNRLVKGPGQYGSMPTGVRANRPWRTLLFRPDRKHYGAADMPTPGSLPDHLYMDLFWMPVVEPYAISMPFATRGKINLNYQIIPFDNIKRQTALHALMKAERITAIPNEDVATYKEALEVGAQGNRLANTYEHEINAEETLQQAEDRFRDGELFRSPTEICELYLVPDGSSLGERVNSTKDYDLMRDYWEEHQLTGDNLKERPYANMQPRLTTKSNVFKVHMIVQTIRKVRSTEPDEMNDRDQISGEWRGSAMIERFIDPNNEDIPNYLGSRQPPTTQTSLDQYYSYRVLHVKQFAP